jgi:hypothetical protein
MVWNGRYGVPAEDARTKPTKSAENNDQEAELTEQA